MAFKYESIVPWGRSYQEYLNMFDLTERDLEGRILGCGDGPAGFNSGMRQRGKRAISVDPIYRFTMAEIEQRIDGTFQNVIGQTRRNADKFIWTKIKDVDELGRIRMSAMREFLKDYEAGKTENRYVCGELPELPFEDGQFDLALSSHFLFLYTDNLSYGFHLKSIDEMLRVSGEVRVFPLLDMNAVRSPYVDRAIGEYTGRGYRVEEATVDYEFQKNGNTMLRIMRRHEEKTA